MVLNDAALSSNQPSVIDPALLAQGDLYSEQFQPEQGKWHGPVIRLHVMLYYNHDLY